MKSTKPKHKTIRLRRYDYQPSKAELEEPVKLDVPGDTVDEKATNLAKALIRPVDISYRD